MASPVPGQGGREAGREAGAPRDMQVCWQGTDQNTHALEDTSDSTKRNSSMMPVYSWERTSW